LPVVKTNVVPRSPFDPQLLADSDYFCRRFGPLSVREFIALWSAADEYIKAATTCRRSPHEVLNVFDSSTEAQRRSH
jgi:hypothetical protein